MSPRAAIVTRYVIIFSIALAVVPLGITGLAFMLARGRFR